MNEIVNRISVLNSKLEERETLRKMLQRHKTPNRGNWYYEEEVLDFISSVL